ncbi:MAG TPA: response regulator [Aggregatilineales bacterium]|nr:response regulator [Anaerolineales bacterium]HRE48043.1 response regulator [Aggregatilineales bacterium]
MNILYLEDEPNDAALVERFVRSTPHHLTLVTTVDEAIATFTPEYDLVLVDVRIGQGRTGHEFVEMLREQGIARPIIAVTALTLPDDMERCYQAGCNAILSKPFRIDQLAALIDAHAS